MLDAAALHQSLLTLDSHVDIPWPDGPGPHVDGPRRVDFPKMRRGGLRAVCFAAFVPQGARDAAGFAEARSRADAMLDTIDRYPDGADDISLASSADEVRAAHAAGRTSTRPVCATHSCVAALRPHPRNLDDLQLDALRDTEGVIQITALGAFLRERDATVSDYVDHLDYVVRRVGVGHVGISSDFDGGGTIKGWRDASETANLTAELVRRGYGAGEIEAFWSGNFLRVLEA